MQAQPAGLLILVLKPRCPDPSRSLCRQGVDLAGFEPATNVDGELTRFPAEGSGSLSCGLLHHGLGPGASANSAVVPRLPFYAALPLSYRPVDPAGFEPAPLQTVSCLCSRHLSYGPLLE